MMEQLKTRQTFDEEWPQSFKQAAVRGKNHLLKLERIRPDTKITMDDILATYKPAQEWWRAI
jgi:hypothetical protein